jgi:hypothetical protein
MHGELKFQNSAEHSNTWISPTLSSSLILYMLWLRHSSKNKLDACLRDTCIWVTTTVSVHGNLPPTGITNHQKWTGLRFPTIAVKHKFTLYKQISRDKSECFQGTKLLPIVLEGIAAGNPDMPSLVEGGSILLMQIKITTITM